MAGKLTYTDCQSVNGNRITYYVVNREGDIQDDRGRIFGEAASGNYWSVEFDLPLEPDEIVVCFFCRRDRPMRAAIAAGQETAEWATPAWLAKVAENF